MRSLVYIYIYIQMANIKFKNCYATERKEDWLKA